MKTTILVIALSMLAFACDETTPTQPPQVPPTPPASVLPALPSGDIVGSVGLADNLKDEVASGDTIFLMARNAATGSLIAVTKLEATATFPLPFKLTSENVMHANTSLAGKVRLEARLDKDGDAMTKKPGDLVGEVPDLVQVPATDVVLTLARRL